APKLITAKGNLERHDQEQPEAGRIVRPGSREIAVRERNKASREAAAGTVDANQATHRAKLGYGKLQPGQNYLRAIADGEYRCSEQYAAAKCEQNDVVKAIGSAIAD